MKLLDNDTELKRLLRQNRWLMGVCIFDILVILRMLYVVFVRWE